MRGSTIERLPGGGEGRGGWEMKRWRHASVCVSHLRLFTSDCTHVPQHAFMHERVRVCACGAAGAARAIYSGPPHLLAACLRAEREAAWEPLQTTAT